MHSRRVFMGLSIFFFAYLIIQGACLDTASLPEECTQLSKRARIVSWDAPIPLPESQTATASPQTLDNSSSPRSSLPCFLTYVSYQEPCREAARGGGGSHGAALLISIHPHKPLHRKISLIAELSEK